MQYDYLLEQVHNLDYDDIQVFDNKANVLFFMSNNRKKKPIDKKEILKLIALCKTLDKPVLLSHTNKIALIPSPDSNFIAIGPVDNISDSKIHTINTVVNMFFWTLRRIINENTSISEQKEYQELEKLILNKNFIKNKIKVNSYLSHNSYSYELAIFDAVEAGDAKRAIRCYERPEKDKVGRHAFTEIRHYQNMGILMAGFAARAAIRAGIPVEMAFTSAEHWIFEFEMCKTIQEAKDNCKGVLVYFADLVKNRKNDYFIVDNNKHVKDAIEFISNRLFEGVTVAEVADNIKISPDHLQRLFKKHLDMNVSDYINREKIFRAKEIMVNSNLNFTEIANLLHFSSSSHFSTIFKKFTMQTPKDYKQLIKFTRENL